MMIKLSNRPDRRLKGGIGSMARATLGNEKQEALERKKMINTSHKCVIG